jgi:hypothetical protein
MMSDVHDAFTSLAAHGKELPRVKCVPLLFASLPVHMQMDDVGRA